MTTENQKIRWPDHDVSTGQSRFPEHNGEWAPTKGPPRLNQRLGTIHGGAGEVRGADGWVPDPPGHTKPDYALENESPVGRGAGAGQGCAPPPPWPRAPFIGTQAGPLPAGLAGGSHAGRLRRFPRASKSEIQPRHNLHSRQPPEVNRGGLWLGAHFWEPNEGKAAVCWCQEGSRRPRDWGKKIR